MKKLLLVLPVAAALVFLAGCATNSTMELKNGRMTLTEERGGRITRWELKEAVNPAEVKILRQAGWQRAGTLHHESAPDTFLLKRKLDAQAVAALTPPPFHPMFVTTPGTNNLPDGPWQVGIPETSLDISRVAGYPGGPDFVRSTISIPPPNSEAVGWATHPGWFVYLENESRAWAYDGDHFLILETWSANGNNSGGATYFNHFPVAPPPEVFSRLTPHGQKAISKD